MVERDLNAVFIVDSVVGVQLLDTEPISSGQALTAEVTRVHWQSSDSLVIDGQELDLPFPSAGDVVVSQAQNAHDYVTGSTYTLFLARVGVSDVSVPWSAYLGLEADGSPVAGTSELIADELNAILMPSEDVSDLLDALIELMIENEGVQRAIQLGAPTPPPSPRLRQLLDLRSSDIPTPTDELAMFLDTPPDHRQLGPLPEDIPEGADEALGVSWVPAEALFQYDTAMADRFGAFGLSTPVGIVGPFSVDAGSEFMVVLGQRGKGQGVDVIAWPRTENSTYEDVPFEVLGSVSVAQIPILDREAPLGGYGAVVVDLRDGLARIVALGRTEYKLLVNSLAESAPRESD